MAVLLIALTVAFAYGKTNVEKGGQKSYFESMNDYDWSRTCPAAGCRNGNDGE